MRFPVIRLSEHFASSSAVATILLTTAVSSSLAAPDITGKWRTPDGATVLIQPCGNSPCGKLIDFKPLNGHSTATTRDINNRDRSKSTRKLQGLTILWNLKPSKTAWQGRIYDPRRGFSAGVTVTRTDASTLSLRGCVSVLIKMCETEKWRRLP